MILTTSRRLVSVINRNRQSVACLLNSTRTKPIASIESSVTWRWTRLMSDGISSDDDSVKKYRVLYDGDCPLCMQEIKFVEYLNKKRKALELVNIASPDYTPEHNNNISYETAMGVMHVIGPDKQVYTKVDAMYEMYAALGMRWMVAYMKWPVLATLFDKAYMIFARNRLQWTAGWRSCDNGKCEAPGESSTKET